MFRNIRILVLASLAAILAACGGGIGVDSNGNVVFTAYVSVAPVVVTTPVVVVPMQYFPQSCIVWEGGNTYRLYGYGYYGCPQLVGRDLLSLFESTFYQYYVDAWTYPSYGTVRISLR